MTDHNKIKTAIDGIEPREGARERMLSNIRQKAAQNSQSAPNIQDIKALPAVKKNAPMFMKIAKWALPIAACLVVAVAAVKVVPIVAAPSESDQGVLGGSPFEAVYSPEEFKTRLGIALDAPAGAENIEYTIIDGNMADIRFTFGGNGYCLRASKQSGDFSGINGAEIAAEQLDGENSALLATIKSGADTYLKLTWTDGVINYVLSDTESGDVEAIKKVYALIK